MNLALLNPFRQADRIDSTLTIPRALHPPRPKSDTHGGGGRGGSSGNNSNNKKSTISKKQNTTSSTTSITATAATTASSTGESEDKKKKNTSSSDKATESGGGGGGGGFKIPKKQKFNNDGSSLSSSSNSNSNKLFRQSLKLSKLSPKGSGSGSGGGGGGYDDDDDDVVGDAASSSALETTIKSKEGIVDEIMDADIEMKDDAATNGEITTTATTTTNEKIPSPVDADNEEDDAADESNNISTPKSKKKRKKKSKSSETEDEDDNNNNNTNSTTTTTAVAIATVTPNTTTSNTKTTTNNTATSMDATDDDDESENYWTACYAVSFNRRGSFLASGHASGLIPVHDFLGRTMSALYWPPPPISLGRIGSNKGGGGSGSGSGSVTTITKKKNKMEKKKKMGKASISGSSRGSNEKNNAGAELRTFVYGDHGGVNNKDVISSGTIGNTTSGIKNGQKGDNTTKEKKKRGPKAKKKKVGSHNNNNKSNKDIVSKKKEEDVVTSTSEVIAAVADHSASSSSFVSSPLVKISSSDDLLVSAASTASTAATTTTSAAAAAATATATTTEEEASTSNSEFTAAAFATKNVGAATIAASSSSSLYSTTEPVPDPLAAAAAAVMKSEKETNNDEGQHQQQQQQQGVQQQEEEEVMDDVNSNQQLRYMNGVTSLSWDRRSRTLLAGAIGDKNLRLMDNTHPLVSIDCTDAVRRQFLTESGGKDVPGDSETPFTLDEKKAAVVASCPHAYTSLPSPPTSLFPGYRGALSSSSIGDHNEKGVITSARIAIRMEMTSIGRARLLRSKVVSIVGKSRSGSRGGLLPSSSGGTLLSPITLAAPSIPKSNNNYNIISVPVRRHPTILLELPQPLGGPVELHPRDSHAGLACMIDGSLALFYLPPTAFYETLHGKDDDDVSKQKTKDAEVHVSSLDNEKRRKYVMNVLQKEESSRVGNLAYLVPPPIGDFDSTGSAVTRKPTGPQYFITCAAFGKHGHVLWAVTKCGNLLAFRIDPSMMSTLRGRGGSNGATGSSGAAVAFANQMLRPTLCVKVPGGAAAWQIIVSRNGKYILINSADCSLRLFDVAELSKAFNDGSTPGPMTNRKDYRNNRTQNADVKPRFVFQDNISKAPWASCDFSGDGEYVCGGCNSYPQPGDNYKLFLWNCITGELVDQLTGPVSSLYSLSCHPTRPFIAVGTSDGLIDVWGARLDWVAFAPDFQALQQNELYEEKEDEFDIVVDGDDGGDTSEIPGGKRGGSVYIRLSPEDDDVDITTIGTGIPAFDSDSEDESDVFYFDTKVDKILSEKQPGPKKAEHE